MLEEVNFFGTQRLIQAELPSMKERQNGLIINYSSYTGVVRTPFLDLYCATKLAIEGLTKSIAPSLLHFNFR